MFLKVMHFYFWKCWNHLKLYIRWLIFSGITGLVAGALSSAFAISMSWVTKVRGDHPWILYTLPLIGLVIVFLYSVMQYKNDKGTNLVLSMIHAQADIPIKMAPLIFFSTVLTHLGGGSAGREGAALQLGGSVGNQLGSWFHFDEKDKRVVVMCGMSAAFAAVFGTPMAAAIFSMEVVSVGVMYYAALVPCIFASLTASYFAADMGINPEAFQIAGVPALAPKTVLGMILLSACCAVLSVLFCILLHKTGDMYRRYLKNPYVRIFCAGTILVMIYSVLGTNDYMGAGIPVIERAISGSAVPWAFILKMILTALTLEAGYKGGEIVPSFFVGATFGCVFGQLLGISPSLCAATGMIAVFCGVTNCPISSILISFELFGFEGVPYFLIAISTSYMLSGYYGLYNDQTIVYSKYKTQLINRKAKK